MIRLALVLSVLGSPLAAQSAPTEASGRLLLMPDAPVDVMEPATSGPLIGADGPRPVIEMVAPDAGPDLNAAADPLVLVAPGFGPGDRPETLPVPRPRDVARGAPPEVAPDTVAGAAGPEVDAAPVVAPQAVATAARAEALARILAEEAQEITAAAPRMPVRPVEDAPSAPDGDVTQSGLSEADAALTPALPVRAPRATVPVVAVSVVAMGPTEPLALMPAVLLPDAPGGWRPVVQPASVVVPRPDPAPVLSRPRPRAPAAQDILRAPVAPWAAPLSAVLFPQMPSDPPVAPQLIRVAAPGPDLFPASALPPGSLPEGPEALTRAMQPHAGRTEAMAAVLIPPPGAGGAAAAMPEFPTMPIRDAAPVSPEAPIRLPDPNPQALARMIDDAMICWRLADLTPEARWAEIVVDVALDETNMPAETSIRLTGFRGVVSGAAADAYRAARGALAGCAEATGAAPVTEAAALVFDRTGIRLR